jgi:hypothetical protein
LFVGALVTLQTTTAGSPPARSKATHGPARQSSGSASGSTASRLSQPEALATASDGSVLIANQGTNQILRWVPGSQPQVLAGDGHPGFAGDGGPAKNAELNRPWGLAVASDGTTYFADTGNNRVRAISRGGIITTVAGNGVPGSSSLGGQALQPGVSQPLAVAVGHQGQIYVVDDAGVQAVSREGVVTTVVRGGGSALDLPGGPTAFFPDAIALNGAGDLFVATLSPKMLLEFSQSGELLHALDNVYVSQGVSRLPRTEACWYRTTGSTRSTASSTAILSPWFPLPSTPYLPLSEGSGRLE